MSGDASSVVGPLQGYHHETYVFPLPDGSRFKCREPRAQILWFDRRCFDSEDELLCALRGRVKRIPEVVEIEGTRVQRFIEGQTLRSLRLPGRRIPPEVFWQIVGLFRQTARITPDMLDVVRLCSYEDRPVEGDSDGFLEQLITFAEKEVYQSNLEQFGVLFGDLGVSDESFRYLRKHVPGLRERPFCLLHGDLHRENLIVDPARMLWAIDWELAMLGDPLYDLATHLHLMRYPDVQARRMVEEWCRAVERVRPGSSSGWQRDLFLLLDFKRAQSVFTDVIRVSLSLCDGPELRLHDLQRAARILEGRLAAAAVPLGLDHVPSSTRIMAALMRWWCGDRAGRRSPYGLRPQRSVRRPSP
ncbi:phosphotransferase [Streptomyces sp. NPDC086549]|uniref:phosphotransferase n=1 Tax=Streptomyces sp. NPDC086549 TaxID=3365752 RepID=UPI00382FAF28